MSAKVICCTIVTVTRCARIWWAHTNVSVERASLEMERQAAFQQASSGKCVHCMPLLTSDRLWTAASLWSVKYKTKSRESAPFPYSYPPLLRLFPYLDKKTSFFASVPPWFHYCTDTVTTKLLNEGLNSCSDTRYGINNERSFLILIIIKLASMLTNKRKTGN